MKTELERLREFVETVRAILPTLSAITNEPALPAIQKHRAEVYVRLVIALKDATDARVNGDASRDGQRAQDLGRGAP